jgi:hypothetical protein
MNKTIYLLNIGGNYEPEITALTYPYIRRYATKIGARLHVITERKFPDWPITYEKLQIYELGKQHRNDWNIYVDFDTLIHPDLFDITEHLPKDTVLNYANDFGGARWAVDDYFRRDGRWISIAGWFTIASDWCLDLWRPLDDLTPAEAVAHCSPINLERRFGITADHLIDDYALSRNLAKFGLKYQTFLELQGGVEPASEFHYFWHQYTIPPEQKLAELQEMIQRWQL